MQSSIANGSNRNLAGGFTNFLPDVEVISVDPNEFYSSSDDDEDYVNVDDDPAIVIVESDESTSNVSDSNEAGLNHISSLIPDNNLFDVIELNINDDMLPDLQYDDIFLANRNNEPHQFDLASYINGESTSMILSPLELPSAIGRRPLENRSSLARKRISFSVDLDEEQTKSHLDNSGTQSVNNLHNNRFSGKLAANAFRGKWIPCDNDINMYLNDDNSNDSNAAIATKFDVPTSVEENTNQIQASIANEALNSMDAVINCHEVDEITIEDVKIERPPTPSSITITSEDSRCSISSGDSGYRATTNETSNENSPHHLNNNCESIVDNKSQSNENNVELAKEEAKPNTKRKLNIQEYLRRKTLKVASEQNATTKECGLSVGDTKSISNSKDAARNDENGAIDCNKSLYEEIIVVSMGCNTDVSIPATPFIHPKNTEIAKSTALLCNIQSAVEKLNSTTDTSKLSSSSLISSIQNEILKKTNDSVGCNAKPLQTPLKNEKHDNENNGDESELEHGENKVIMHLPRDRIRPMNWSISIQTEPYFQFPPLELLAPLAVKKSQSREFGEQSRDSQYLSQSHSSSESSGDESSGDDSDSSTSSSISSSSSRASSRTYYKDGQHRRTYRERRSSNSSGYHTYASSKRSTSPGTFYNIHLVFTLLHSHSV